MGPAGDIRGDLHEQLSHSYVLIHFRMKFITVELVKIKLVKQDESLVRRGAFSVHCQCDSRQTKI